MERVYTIGYEGKHIQEFISLLKRNNVKLVVDVRANPISRKKGFTKKTLNLILHEYGLKYIHMEELGNPKEIRETYSRNGSVDYLFSEYKKYLDKHTEAIEYLMTYIGNTSACLMCFEKKPTECHRGAIAEYLYFNKGVAISHL